MNKDVTISGLLGVCVGDALGVPVEFSPRNTLIQAPVTTMQGYGTYNQPPGTWSDDSSLTLCLAQALSETLLQDKLYPLLGTYFCRWYQDAYWTPHNKTFDIGNTTERAISRILSGISLTEAGGSDEHSNGNGSLMRILPMAFCYELTGFSDLIEKIHQISALTHAHPRSQIACGIYTSIAIQLLQGKTPMTAYQQGLKLALQIYQNPPYLQKIEHFRRIITKNIAELPINQLNSSGYVIDTLEASLWCFLNSRNYTEAVLQAVNLGEDTDTTAAVTGGLAGIYYGLESIPLEWLKILARKDDIIQLGEKLANAIKVAVNR